MSSEYEKEADYPVEVSGMTDSQCMDLIRITSKRIGIFDKLTDTYISTLIEESDGHPYIIKVILGEAAIKSYFASPQRVVAKKDAVLDALFKRTFSTLSKPAKRVFLTLCSWRSVIPQIALESVLLREENEDHQWRDCAVITLWAAGGTKNLTIGNSDKEVHELFGVPTKTMVNTAAPNGVDGLQPVIFRIDLGATDWNKQHNANDIKVYVEGKELKAEQGKAPQKVEVSSTTRWMKEMLIITSGYAKFAEYATSNTPTDWYKTVTDASKLY